MENKFDVAVIGSGVAGSAAAFECKKNNLKVAVIEKGLFGGTCPNRGCDPKKVLGELPSLLTLPGIWARS